MKTGDVIVDGELKRMEDVARRITFLAQSATVPAQEFADSVMSCADAFAEMWAEVSAHQIVAERLRQTDNKE